MDRVCGAACEFWAWSDVAPARKPPPSAPPGIAKIVGDHSDSIAGLAARMAGDSDLEDSVDEVEEEYQDSQVRRSIGGLSTSLWIVVVVPQRHSPCHHRHRTAIARSGL